MQIAEQAQQFLFALGVALFESLVHFHERLLPKLGVRLQFLLIFVLQTVKRARPDFQLPMDRFIQRRQAGMIGYFHRVDKRRELFVDHLEPTEQFAIDPAIMRRTMPRSVRSQRYRLNIIVMAAAKATVVV